MKILNLHALLFFCLILVSCGTQAQNGEDTVLFPTQPVEVEPVAALEEDVVQPGEASVMDLTPTPNIADWVIGSVVEDWQKPAINEVVQAYWSLLYHPPSGVPDCAGAAAYIKTPYENFLQGVLDACRHFSENKYFVRALPLPNHSVQYFGKDELGGTDEEFRGVIVELDTGDTWTGKAHYFPDGGYYGTTQEPHVIWRIFLRIVDGQWWVYGATREVLE